MERKTALSAYRRGNASNQSSELPPQDSRQKSKQTHTKQKKGSNKNMNRYQWNQKEKNNREKSMKQRAGSL